MNKRTWGLILILIVLVLYTAQILANVKAERININVGVECVEKITIAAAGLEGVISTNWDPKEKELEIVYEDDKITLEDIEQAIAEAGFNTPRFKAPKSTYGKLPRTCRKQDAISFDESDE